MSSVREAGSSFSPPTSSLSSLCSPASLAVALTPKPVGDVGGEVAGEEPEDDDALLIANGDIAVAVCVVVRVIVHVAVRA